ncbi:MAG: YbaB/EbfC family nucleoid-associated protein [Rhodospirillaceae bacterium]|nr:YbaB/EbfC family nucleoid-associated protein [Rhodospirillaceae bacterium]
MKNLGNMMKQAQQMQAKMADLQERLGEIEAVGESGAGMVKVTLTGKKEARAVSIAPSLVDPEDIEVLEDLLVAAFNDAAGRVDQTVQEETQKLMGDIKLPPGMKLPF